MNIFILDRDPVLAAQMVIDKHLVKMPLETAQLLCTVSVLLGGTAPYKPTHKNHPSTLWTKESLGNWNWVYTHGLGLCKEYTRRYGKVHKCQEIIELMGTSGAKPEGEKLTEFRQVMPDKYKCDDAVEAYRAYYLGEKVHMASWKTPAQPPDWWKV